MSILQGFVKIASGAAETAVLHQANAPAARKAAGKRRKKSAEDCSPCAAGAYTEQLHQRANAMVGRAPRRRSRRRRGST